jgi:hypothetical protein
MNFWTDVACFFKKEVLSLKHDARRPVAVRHVAEGSVVFWPPGVYDHEIKFKADWEASR